MDAIEKQYRALIASGEFAEMFPHLSGDWSQDKTEFIKEHEQNEAIFNDTDDEEDDFYYDQDFYGSHDF